MTTRIAWRCGVAAVLRRLRSAVRITLLYWLLKWVLLGPWLRLIFRPQVEGLEHVPRDGAAIIASNHISFSDSIFMPLMVKRKVTFVAKAEYFTGTGIKGFLTRMFFTAAGTIPVDRSGGRGGAGRHRHRSAGAARRASCSASTRRAPGPRTAGCTGARPAWPGWP